MLPEDVKLRWRDDVSDGELVDLTRAHGGVAVAGWWDRVREHSLGWASARRATGELIGFVNVAWDGGDHAFLLDPKVHADYQRRGIGTELVRRCEQAARDAGCSWLHVDFRPELRPFYFQACGFRATDAGLIDLSG